ncbi:MAG TPA: hypothetical protein VKT77_19650 [Chthonomonadaceae bacterium]|nr:hypothetical protein [Chthonomonadaceae bacterium]
MRNLLLSTLLLCMFAVAASADTWVEHHDPRGFTVRHPKGWTVTVAEGATIVVRGAGEGFVVAQPFYLKAAEGSGDWLRSVPRRHAALFPGARITRLEQTSRTPDQALAALSYQSARDAGRAAVLCSIYGRSGMFYGIAGPAGRFDTERELLVRVLSSFRFTQPAAGSAAPAAAKEAEVRLSYTRWSDPVEGAFTLEAPRGWKVQGGLVRRNALDARQAVDMVSPDGSVLVRVGDGSVPAYTPPTPALAAAGFFEGRVYTIGAGLNYIVARPQSGLAFAKSYLAKRVTAPFADIQVVSEKARPDLANLLHSIAAQYGESLVRYTFDVGEVAFTCQKEGHPMHGVCYGTVMITTTGGFSVWGAWPAGYVAPTGSDALAETVLRHAVTTLQLDPAWIARQSQTAVDVSHIATRSNAEISKTINDSYWRRHAVIDDVSRKWSNVTLGLTDVRDPETGETWKVASGHNYYWRKGDTAVGTDGFQRPDIDFTPLKEW